ncbi:MAG: hypothetical protein ACTHNW_05535 [Mucilaginibacter sp.]
MRKYPFILNLLLLILISILFVSKGLCNPGDTTICFFKKVKYYNDVRVNKLADADYFRVLILNDPADPDSTVQVQEFYKDGKQKLLGTSKLKTGNARSPSIKLYGSWASYFPNGKKMGMYNAADAGNQYVYFFYPTGEIYMCIKNGLNWECYDKDGNMTCKEGNGLWSYYDQDFNLVTLSGMVKNGYQNGIWHGDTHRSDSIKYTYRYKMGVLADRTGFDKNGKAYPFDYVLEKEGYYAYKYSYNAGEKNIGGPVAFLKDVRTNLKWPHDEKGKKISIDTMHVVFTIEGEGVLSNISLLGDVDPKVNAAIVTAVKQCKNWHPVKYYGIPLKTIIVCPLSYTSKYYNGAPPVDLPAGYMTEAGINPNRSAYYGSHVDYKRFLPDL